MYKKVLDNFLDVDYNKVNSNYILKIISIILQNILHKNEIYICIQRSVNK